MRYPGDCRRVPALAAARARAAAAGGQRGPLYLRDNPPPGVKAEKRDTYKPVPYPPSQPEEDER